MGETVTLQKSTSSDLVGKAFTWYSDNSDVATVDQNGKVTALNASVKNGRTNIHLIYNGIASFKVCEVTVKEKDTAGISDKEYFDTYVDIYEKNKRQIAINYKMNYSWFFDDNTKYNPELSTTSSIFSSLIYNDIELLNRTDTTKNDYYIDELMRFHCMSDVKIYELTEKEYGDQHLTALAIGHRRVVYKGEAKEIFLIAVRGTNGTLEEWSSNFDIGCSDIFNNRYFVLPNQVNSESQYSTKILEKNPDWIIKENHMGFDIAATRVIKIFNNYLNEYSRNIDSGVKKVLWITGHSRGGAIANIVGSRLDNAYETFVYTFAAPNTTTVSDSYALSHRSIFNIINTDDLVPCFPLSSWGFKRYGNDRSASISANSSYSVGWNALTKVTYTSNVNGLRNLITDIGKLAKTRDDCYKYTCNCHGDGSDGANTTVKNSSLPLKYGNEYCINETFISVKDGKTVYRCETSAYLMQYLSDLISNNYKFIADISKKYEDVKWSFILFGDKYMHNPHEQITYYYLSRKV